MNKVLLSVAVLAVPCLILSGCSGCGGQHDGHDGDQMDQAGAHDGADMNDHGDGAGHADGMDHGNDQAMDGANAESMEPRTFLMITYSTPAEERSGTTTALNGLRTTLMAELEAVRGRLRQGGTDAEAKKADQTRAAELAQGLERLDRLIAKVGEADDVTWAQVRESSLQEAEEVRLWMSEYNMANSI